MLPHTPSRTSRQILMFTSLNTFGKSILKLHSLAEVSHRVVAQPGLEVRLCDFRAHALLHVVSVDYMYNI